MNKLGIVINRIHQGLIESYALNKTENWADNIRDTRDDLKTIICTEGEDMVVYMMIFNHLGCYFCIIRVISGRIGDQVAAWIFIPRNMKISAEELLLVIENIKNSVLKSQIDEDSLTNLFSKEYPDKTVPAEYAASTGSDYAFRYYGIGTEYSLQELLGGLYQPYYSKYKAVFLLDKASNAQCRGNDLSEEEIRKIVILFQPKQNPDSFVPYFENENSAFTSPKCVALRQQIKVTWRRSGYEDVQKSFVVEEDGQQAPAITVDDYIRIISKKDFNISDSEGNKVENFNVVIGKHTIDEQHSLKCKEIDLRNPKRIIIGANGFEQLNVDCDLLKLPINLTVKREVYLCKFMIPFGGDGYISTEEITPKKTFSESPIDGYCLDGSPQKDGKCLVHYLRYRGSNEQRGKRVNGYSKNGTDEYDKGFEKGYGAGKRDELQRTSGKRLFGVHPLIALLLSFVLGAVISAVISISCVSLFSSGNKDSTKNAQPDGGINVAIQYLEQNKRLLKDSMELYPVLQGLFDEMNCYKFESIVQRETLLGQSEKFKKICNAIRGRSDVNGLYCEDYNAAITIDTYIEHQKKERQAAINYLSSKTKWEKEKMDSLLYLRGLFDALDAYKVDIIKDFDSNLESEKLRQIIKKLEEKPKYITNGNTSIVINQYISSLTPKPSEKGRKPKTSHQAPTAGSGNTQTRRK